MKHYRKWLSRGSAILTGNGDICEFGRLLHEGWKIKRTLSSQVSNERIDWIYEKARSEGAIGGKICGAGGGGFLLLFVAPDRRDKVREALKDYLHVPIELGSPRFANHCLSAIRARGNDLKAWTAMGALR